MSATSGAVRHALLRAGQQWPGVDLYGLVAAPGGDLTLRRVPGVAPPSLRPAGAVAPSGLAVDTSCGLYVADTSGNRVLRVALDCHDRQVLPGRNPPAPLPGTFDAPAGLAIGPFGWLYVADGGSGRILVLTTPALGLRDAWTAQLVRPAGVAGDGDLGVVVLDAGASRVRRFDPFGRPDAGFDAALAAHGPHDPRAIAVDEAGTVYVAAAAAAAVFRFDRDGQSLGPPLAAGLQGRALAVAAGMLYLADAASGQVLLFSVRDGRRLGAVAGYSGPVAALAVDSGGTVYIKPDLGAGWLTARSDAAFVALGSLLPLAPLDAGEDSVWLRVGVSATTGEAGSVTLETCTSDQPSGPPQWAAAAATATLLPPGRYLWVRVTVATRDPSSSPVVRQVEAETTGDSYLDHLPAVYGREPATADFVTRLLELARVELGGLENVVAALPSLFDPATAPAGWLDWLAGWQAFDVPVGFGHGRRPDALRALLARLPGLHERRGTLAGLADLVEIYAGVRPHLFEEFRARGVWVLDESSALGFDTVLPAATPDGLIVGEATVGQSRPEPAGAWASDLFADAAHRFTVVLPAARAADERAQRLIRRVLDAEKPAHTDYHLCLAGPSMRVGTQARVGVDAIVAGPGPGLVLDEHASLNLDARLPGDPPGSAGSVGSRDRVGVDTRLG